MSSLSPRTYPAIDGLSAPPAPPPFGPPAAPQLPENENPPRFKPQILRSLRMHPLLAISVTALVFMTLVILALRQTSMYSAQSLVYIEPVVPGSYSGTGVPGYDQFRYASFVDQQMQTVIRPDILVAALKALPSNTWKQPKESFQAAALRLQKNLVVERELTSYQISIKLLTTDPQASANIVNAVTDAYLQGGRRDENAQANGRARLLTEERQRITEQLDRDRKEESSLGTNLGVANPVASGENPFDTQLANLRVQLATARQAHDVASAQLSSVSGSQPESKSGLTAAADESISTDIGLGSMKSAVNARRVVLETQMAGLTPNNPAYKQDQDEIAELDRRLETLTKQEREHAEVRIQDKLRTELQRTAAVEGQLNSQLAQATSQATGAGPKLQRASELATDIQRLSTQYATVDETLRELALQTDGPAMEHLALAASAPVSPEPNKRLIMLAGALPVGLLFGVLAAVIARARDRRIYIGADVEEAIGFLPMAVLPAVEDVPSHVFDEYILRLAAGFEGAYRNNSARIFVLTPVSMTTGGNPFLKSLADTLEQMRLRVQISQAADLLAPSSETAEYLAVGSSVPALTRYGTQAGEGIASSKLDRLKNNFDIILIDAEPLLHSAATEYAARCSDAAILVVQSGVTLSTELTEAAALLARLRVTGVAAVLSGLRLQHADDAFKAAVQASEHLGVKPKSERKPTAKDALPLTEVASRTVPEPKPPDEPEVLEQATLDEAAELKPVEVEQVLSTAQATEAEIVTEPLVGSPSAEVDLSPQTDQVAVAEMPSPVEPTQPTPGAIEVSSSEEEVVDQPVKASRPLARRLGKPAVTRRSNRPVPVRSAARRALHQPSEALSGIPEPTSAYEQLSQQDLQPVATPPLLIPISSPPSNLQPVGLLVTDSGLAEPMPSETQSKIRLAFRDQEVNAKTTWFSKLFRGNSSLDGKTPMQADGADDSLEGRPVERLPEITHTSDPELSHLLSRVSRSYRVPSLTEPLQPVPPPSLQEVPRRETFSEPVIAQPSATMAGMQGTGGEWTTSATALEANVATQTPEVVSASFSKLTFPTSVSKISLIPESVRPAENAPASPQPAAKTKVRSPFLADDDEEADPFLEPAFHRSRPNRETSALNPSQESTWLHRSSATLPSLLNEAAARLSEAASAPSASSVRPEEQETASAEQDSSASSMSRRWALLSRFEPNRGDANPTQSNEER